MPAVEIISGDYPSIRAAIDISLDADSLPDAVIGLDIYATAAEQWIAAETTETGTEAHLAAVLYCAYLIAPQVPALMRERMAGGEYWQQPFDYVDLAGRLLQRAYQQLALAQALVTPAADASEQPTMFALGTAPPNPYRYDY